MNMIVKDNHLDGHPFHVNGLVLKETVMPNGRVPQNQQEDRVSYVEQSAISSLNSDSLCVQHIGIIREPRAKLGCNFYYSRGYSEGFLRFRIPDWLTFA